MVLFRELNTTYLGRAKNCLAKRDSASLSIHDSELLLNYGMGADLESKCLEASKKG